VWLFFFLSHFHFLIKKKLYLSCELELRPIKCNTRGVKINQQAKGHFVWQFRPHTELINRFTRPSKWSLMYTNLIVAGAFFLASTLYNRSTCTHHHIRIAVLYFGCWVLSVVWRHAPDWTQFDQQLVSYIFSVMTRDALLTSHPVSAEIRDPDDITLYFDAISYDKVGLSWTHRRRRRRSTAMQLIAEIINWLYTVLINQLIGVYVLQGMAVLRLLRGFLGWDGFRDGLKVCLHFVPFIAFDSWP